MHVAYLAENIIDANLVRDALEAADIPAYVDGAFLAGASGELPALGMVRVLVADAHGAAARPVVEAIERDLAEARAAVDEADAEPGGAWGA